MIHNVPISAAPTERNWSIRNGIHTKLRNRMEVDTSSIVTYIKHNMTLEYGHFFKKKSTERVREELERKTGVKLTRR